MVQDCPPPAQVLGWHVPLVAPAGTAHELPVQQSAVVVQTEPCGWHAAGTLQSPPMHCWEQHCPAEVQAVSLPWHVPASELPASGVPASGLTIG
jgi:hypothetical protein